MRAIDADALMETINRHCYPVQHDMTSIEPGMTRIGILQAIQEQPTIEPERKKGKWIEQDDGWDGVYYECSVCKEPFTLIDGTPSENLYNFCPNCGARMTEEDV